jgi:hypothetical protein
MMCSQLTQRQEKSAWWYLFATEFFLRVGESASKSPAGTDSHLLHDECLKCVDLRTNFVHSIVGKLKNGVPSSVLSGFTAIH